MHEASFLISCKITRVSKLHVQGGYSGNIPLDQLLCGLHLGKELRIPNNPRRIFHLPARFIQSSDNTNDRPLQYIREIGNAIERHTPCPFIDDFDKTKAGTTDKVV